MGKELLNKEQQDLQKGDKEKPGFIEEAKDNGMVDIKIAMVPGKTYNLTVPVGTSVKDAIEKAQKLHNIKVEGKMAKIGKRAVDLETKLQGGEILMLVANVTGGFYWYITKAKKN